jgi:hypothetical protein
MTGDPMPPRSTRPLKTDEIAQTAVDPQPADTGLAAAHEGPATADVEPADSTGENESAGTDPPAPDGAPGPGDVNDEPDQGDAAAADAPSDEPSADAAADGQSDRPDPLDDPVVAEGVASYEENQQRDALRPLTIDLES